jgi:hypothetical protein
LARFKAASIPPKPKNTLQSCKMFILNNLQIFIFSSQLSGPLADPVSSR